AGYVGLFALAAARTDRARAGPDWRVAALATGAIPVFTRLTAYYHAALVGLALLHRRTPAAGIALCALAAATQAIAMRVPFADVPFVWMSLCELLAVIVVTLAAARASADRGATSARAAVADGGQSAGQMPM